MYFSQELGRWVERGKESEALQAHCALAPPPTTLSHGCPQACSTSRRSLAQRYVLQSNLRVAPATASVPLLPGPPPPPSTVCALFEPGPVQHPSPLLLPAGNAHEQELPSSGPPSSGSDCSPFSGSRSTTRSNSSSSLAGPDSRTSSCNGASRATQSGTYLADGLAGSFDLLRSAYSSAGDDEPQHELQPLAVAADGQARAVLYNRDSQPAGAMPLGGLQPISHNGMELPSVGSGLGADTTAALPAHTSGPSQAGADGSTGAAALNRILSLSLSFHADGSAPSSPSGVGPRTAPASPIVIKSHAINCAEDASPGYGQSFTFACAVPSSFTFDVPAAAAESAQQPAPLLVRPPASQPQQQAPQQLEQQPQQPEPAAEQPASAVPSTAATAGSAVDEVLQKLKQLRGALLEASPPSGATASSPEAGRCTAAAAPQLSQTVAEAARALAGLGMLQSPFAGIAAEAAAEAPAAKSSSPCSPPPTFAPTSVGSVKALATPAVAPPPRRRCVASPDSPSGSALRQGQGRQQVPVGYVPVAQLQREQAARAALAAQLERERADRMALAAQLARERSERAAMDEQLVKVRAERAALERDSQRRLELETSQRAMLASQLSKEAAERACLASQLDRERAVYAARLQKEQAERAAWDAELAQLRMQVERMSRAAAQEQQQRQQPQSAMDGSGEGAEEDGEDEKDMLMLCLGEQSRKVEVLAAALLAAGVDPAPLLASVEEAAAVC
ncbi:hypothetical protein HYH02_010206 [Chlamydomonas schloesseri]|uniref:Uncharacterized protein n=1 Tax=Chlamydomonas schloesseri TaxID=2026947 RepID=A0A835TBI5_9CHLO|nr:hypothetical protein HYH02_010206 [Chlamydomonas schloesseri]|eukprot:KAG2440627.1 hypothetical protein HYH02_010206 [Chlamydomonas schloesseri]